METTHELKTVHNFATYLWGIIFNLILSLLVYFLMPFPSNIAAVIFVWIYFGYFGLTKKIEIGWAGVPTIFGRRLKWPIIPEGISWMLPGPIMNFQPVDCREKTLDIPVEEVLSSDNIPVSINTTAQIKIFDPYKSLSVKDLEKSLGELVDRTVRWEANKKGAIELPGEKEALSTAIESEADKVTIERWGTDVVQIFVNDVRLPKQIEDAMTKKQAEKDQKEYETTEFNHVLTMLGGGDIENGKQAWQEMRPQERAKIMQAERGKRIVVTVDGNAGDFTKGQVAAEAMRKGGKR